MARRPAARLLWPGLLLLVLALMAAVCTSRRDPLNSRAVNAALKQIRPEALRAHMRFLTDDKLQGRAAGAPGCELASSYVVAQLEALGLKPAGWNGSYYQSVPLRKAVLKSEQSRFEMFVGGKRQALTEGKDFVLTADLTVQKRCWEADLVFAGFGVTAPEAGYDDYQALEVQGKIVVIANGAPPKFPPTVRAYYSNDMIKAANAEQRGALGIITLRLPEEEAREPWTVDGAAYREGEMRWLHPDGRPYHPFSYGGLAVLNRRAAVALFSAGPKSFETVCAYLGKGQLASFPLPCRVSITKENIWGDFQSANVIARLDGSDPALRGQYILYSAHVDHLGLSLDDGDKVCHGAIDNASGVASLLEIARALTLLPQRPRRSILFLFNTGEEAGLLGSSYFVHFPTVTKEKIKANINIDCAPGFLFPMKNLVALGSEHSTIQSNVERAAKRMGYALAADPMPEENNFVRGDQFSFVLQGIPAINVIDGPDSADPRIDGLQTLKQWNATRYHTPQDNMDQPLDFASGVRATGFHLLLGLDLAQQRGNPAWHRNDFFGKRFSR